MKDVPTVLAGSVVDSTLDLTHTSAAGLLDGFKQCASNEDTYQVIAAEIDEILEEIEVSDEAVFDETDDDDFIAITTTAITAAVAASTTTHCVSSICESIVPVSRGRPIPFRRGSSSVGAERLR